MAIKPISYQTDAEPLIEAAVQQAKRHKKTFSQFALEALEDRVKKAAAEPAPAERWDKVAANAQSAA